MQSPGDCQPRRHLGTGTSKWGQRQFCSICRASLKLLLLPGIPQKGFAAGRRRDGQESSTLGQGWNKTGSLSYSNRHHLRVSAGLKIEIVIKMTVWSPIHTVLVESCLLGCWSCFTMQFQKHLWLLPSILAQRWEWDQKHRTAQIGSYQLWSSSPTLTAPQTRTNADTVFLSISMVIRLQMKLFPV